MKCLLLRSSICLYLLCLLVCQVIYITTAADYSDIRVAICYWGLTRSTKLVYQSHETHVWQPLRAAGIPFDRYLHTWNIKENVVWNKKMHTAVDHEEWKYLEPKAMQVDNQDEFLHNLTYSKYFYEHERHREWLPQLLRNHLCALESMKRVTNLCISMNLNYTHIMFLRPDVRVYSTLPIHLIFEGNHTNNVIFIPNTDHFHGYNDRFAIVPYLNVMWYSHRINYAPTYRKEVGPIVSEPFNRYIIDEHYYPSFIPFLFRLVRPDGKEVANE